MKKLLISLSLLCASFSVFGMDRTVDDRTGGASSASSQQDQAEPRRTAFELLRTLAKSEPGITRLDCRLDDRELIQEAVAAFERTCNFERSIPLICTQAHIAEEKVARFIRTHQKYPMTLSLSPHSYQHRDSWEIHALHDYHIVGGISFDNPAKGKYHISMLRVREEYLRQGIGSMLLLSSYATIIAHARNQGQSSATI